MSDDGEATIADRYDVVRPLGRGSFGRTLLARDRVTDRMVAVKLLDPRGAADWKARELFEREASVLRSLRHAGIPEMHDLATDSVNGVSSSVLVMEYIEGISIADVIEQQGSMDGADVVTLFLQMLRILEYLHEWVPPVLHRDIKPANIILRPDGSPALVDFGSVRSVGLGPEESGSTVAGTYGYMPYEQYMGQASPVSDLYALAATFLHLVTRRPPRDFMAANGSIQVPDHLLEPSVCVPSLHACCGCRPRSASAAPGWRVTRSRLSVRRCWRFPSRPPCRPASGCRLVPRMRSWHLALARSRDLLHAFSTASHQACGTTWTDRRSGRTESAWSTFCRW